MSHMFCPAVPDCTASIQRRMRLASKKNPRIVRTMAALLVWGVCIVSAARLLSCYFVSLFFIRRLRNDAAADRLDTTLVGMYESTSKNTAILMDCAMRTRLANAPLWVMRRIRSLMKAYMDEVAMIKAANRIFECLDDQEINSEHLSVVP